MPLNSLHLHAHGNGQGQKGRDKNKKTKPVRRSQPQLMAEVVHKAKPLFFPVSHLCCGRGGQGQIADSR